MIAWLVGIMTLILVLFIIWRARSSAFRERCEAPKYRFLEQLGVSSRREDNTEDHPNLHGGTQ